MLDESFRNSRFLYTPSIFHAILAASLFTFNGRDNRLKRAGTILTVVYIIVLFLLLQQNNHPWREAGRIVHSTYTSAAELIERRAGEWGVTHKKLLAFNIPRTYIGAVALDWGFQEMLQLRHAGELSGVDIEVIHGGIQTQENFNKVDNVIKEGGIVWLYVDRDRELVEYGSIPTVSSKWPK